MLLINARPLEVTCLSLLCDCVARCKLESASKAVRLGRYVEQFSTKSVMFDRRSEF